MARRPPAMGRDSSARIKQTPCSTGRSSQAPMRRRRHQRRIPGLTDAAALREEDLQSTCPSLHTALVYPRRASAGISPLITPRP
jgi:hypothetical protein